MDPQQQFKERYNSYIEQRNSQVGQPTASTPPPSSKKYSPNKFYVLGIIVGLLIIAPVASYLFLANKVANPSSKVANNDQASITQPSEAQVNAELQRVWGPYYEEVKNDPKYRAQAKQGLITQQVIKEGLAENKIQTSSIASDNPGEQMEKQEDKLEQAVLTSRNVDYAYVFIDTSSPNYNANVEKITYSYNLLKKYVSQGKTMQQAYDIAKNDPGFFDSITITNNDLLYKNTFDKSVSEPLFKYAKGQTTDIINSGGGTFMIAHINDAKNTPYATMDEWLKAQK